MSLRVTYEHELDALNADLKQMALMAEHAIEETFVAFEDQDFERAEDVIKGDRNVNDMERAIEARCLSLILRQQPVACDLRKVSTALKVVTDIERIGDHASDIAELILRLKSDHAYHIVKHLPVMAQAAQEMVRDAIEAFIKQDLEEAARIIKKDDEVDALFNQVKTDVISLLKASPGQADQAIDLLMVAKYLERIGDHAVNVCEWTQFSKTGALKNVRIM
jgi:phosphate transport system protein